MKKTFIFFLMAFTFGLTACNNDDDYSPYINPNDLVRFGKVAKVADYLYYYEADNYSPDPPSQLLMDNNGKMDVFGCSAVRNGNFYGRNLDFNINEICEFIIKTNPSATRKHASIGVANTCFYDLTKERVEAGLSDELLKYIPWMTLDGINDAGLVCNVNVVNAADLKEKHGHTNSGKPQIMVMQLIRALLDNCGSVEEAKTFVKNYDVRPIPTTWDGHIMIADPNKTVIVEFTGEKGEEVKFVEQKQMIMTNFYNHLYNGDGNFPQHACGIERYVILEKNYATSNTMEGMWNLLKMVRYTLSYDTNVEPFWCSEYYDTAKIPDFDKYPQSYWMKDKVLAEEKPKKEVKAYEEYAKTGKYDPEDGLWFTTHNSTFDIQNRILCVTIRELYDKRYSFRLDE